MPAYHLHKRFITRRLFPLVLAGGLSLFLASCAYFNTYYNAKKYYHDGIKENENNTSGRPQTANYQKAINSAARVIEYYPKSKYVDDAILIMARAYYEIQSYPKSKRKCEEMIANYPSSPLVFEARLYLGKSLIRMRQIEEGIRILNDLWADDAVPEDIRIQGQRTLADYYYEKENYRQALLEYDKILLRLKDKHQRADVRYQIGQCYWELENYAEAETAFLAVLDEKPLTKSRFDAMLMNSKTLQKLGDFEGALKICDKLLKKDIFYDYYDQAYLAKAGILTELGRQDEAVEIYERILELYPRTDISAEAAFRLGQIFWKQLEELEKAEEYFGKVRTEKAQSEFVDEAQRRVTDLRKFKAINRGIDSLNIDLDTLDYQLGHLAELAAQAALDSTHLDSTLETGEDSLLIAQVEPEGTVAPPGSPPDIQQPGMPPQGPGQVGMMQPGMPGPGMNQPGMTPGPGGEPQPPPRPGMDPDQYQQPSSSQQQPIRLAPLPRDSTEVYLRIDDDHKSMAEFRFRLAEHFWTRFNNLDTAQVIITELTDNEYNADIRAKSLLVLHLLTALSSPDSTGPDSLLQMVHDLFPETDYDRWVRPILGLDPLPEPVDTLKETFRSAEELWLTDEMPDQAIGKYLEVVERWPESDLAPKALYASAWIQEWVTEDIDAALASYDSLIAWYPESEYVSIAQNKLAPPPPDEPDSTNVDSLLALAQTGDFGPPPPGTGTPEMIGGEDALQDYILQGGLYPLVAQEAEIPGEVMLTFIVDMTGTAKEFVIQQEEPEGFDFGENAIQAVQAMKFIPGYRDGQYIEAPSSQRVRFNP